MSSIERREREKEQRRQHFIDVAEVAFLDRGFDRTSIEDIARGAEFSKRAVYLYFDEKRELFQAVALRGLNRLHGILRDATTESMSGLDRLRALGHAYYRFFRDERPFFDLLLDYELREYHFARSVSEHGSYEQKCQELNDRNSAIIHDAVQRAIEDGAQTGGLQAAQVTLILWGQVIGILQLIARREDVLETAYGLSPEVFFERSLEASLRGVLS
jgi:AcrR family transcriptional regulator